VSTVRVLARMLGVLPSTMMSRFFRAQLPGPKRYLAMARLVRAAHLLENKGFAIMNVADHLEYSSSQCFGRHIYTLLGMCAGDFRREYNGASMLTRFRKELILPYRATLRQLRPLTTVAGWMKSGDVPA
jgi:methylphosphotriester-DNA--protein-cysteine methyltransferase